MKKISQISHPSDLNKRPSIKRETLLRFRVVRGHTCANEFNASRPVTSTGIGELARARRHTHILRDCAGAGRTEKKVPSKEAYEKILLRC